jgi:putative ABC transport system permease protein
MMNALAWISRQAGFRFLARRKAACAMAVVTVAVALGANTLAFSVLETVLLSVFGLPEPGRTFVIAPVRELPGRGEVIFADAYPNYELIRQTQRSFEDVACDVQSLSSWDDGEETRPLQSARVSANFFSTLGVQPVLGRAFRASEEGPSPAPVVIIGYSVWQSMMAGDPAVIGRAMILDGTMHTVVGVMPEGFAHPLPTEVLLPFDLPAQQRTSIVGARLLGVYGRLRDGVSRRAAALDAEALTRRALEVSQDNRDFRYTLRTVGQVVLPGADRTVVLIQATTLALTLLAVLNLSSLLMAWGFDRRQEMAVRVALGAGGARIMLMLVTQSLAVVAAGAAGGVALADLALPALRHANVGPELALYLRRLALDWSVLGWSAGIAFASGLAAGAFPALVGKRTAVADTLRSSSRGATLSPAAATWQKAMVLGQTGLTVVILSTAALIGTSLRNLATVPDGFVSAHRVAAHVELNGAAYLGHEQRVEFATRLADQLDAAPELASWGFTSTLPVRDVQWGGRFKIELPDGSLSPEPLLFHVRRVSVGYLNTMGIPLLRGRGIEQHDDASQPDVAVVSRAVAERLWPGEDPIGKPLYRVVGNGRQRAEVVGVVGNVMDGGYAAPPGEAVYLPFAQVPVTSMSIVVVPRGPHAAAVTALRRALRRADPSLAASEAEDLAALVRQANALPRLRTVLLAVFALVALGIVALGSYGLMSQWVASREREFSLRIALGARPERIGTAVLSEALRVAAPGVVVGVVLAWPAGDLVRPFVFGVAAHSTGLSVAVAATTLALVGLASVAPAIRAIRVKVSAALSA